jgi:hypothetical protein
MILGRRCWKIVHSGSLYVLGNSIWGNSCIDYIRIANWVNTQSPQGALISRQMVICGIVKGNYVCLEGRRLFDLAPMQNDASQ